jgi:adenine-specific DNA-methyltransferase
VDENGDVIDSQKKTFAEVHENEAETGTDRRASVFIGPEFGTVTWPDLIEAAREAADAGFDLLIACAFNYEAHTTEFEKLGKIKILKARMNADLHMAGDLRNNGKGNLFVIFGEPDIIVTSEEWLVDSSGRRIAPYELFKILSGLNSLAEIKRLGDTDIQMYASFSCNREIWNYLANEAGSDINSGKYCGGTGPQYDWGVSPIAWLCAGFSGGIGNFYNNLRRTCVSQTGEFGRIIESLRRDWENAKFTAKITIHSPLTTNHFSQVRIKGVDVFHPNTGEIRSDGPEGIACWFIDTDYNEESFFVRHAYFLGAGDPYGSLKTSLKAEINEDAWESLHSDVSRSFHKPASGRIAVKVINHLGDEVMSVINVNRA